MRKSVRRLLWIAVPVIVTGLIIIAAMWWLIYSPNINPEPVKSGYYIYVADHYTMDDVVSMLRSDTVLRSAWSFQTLSDYSGSAALLKPGRYRIEPGLSNYRLLQKLRNGLQEPLRFTFNNVNFIEDFCGAAGKVFQFDSLQILEVARDNELLDSLDIKPEMLLGHLLPNTYEVYWTISPEGLIIRMKRESDRFWSGERNAILENRGLKKDDVLIIASIIQKETNHIDEMSRMAGVYINRLRMGMKLQADPTVKYAIGDLTIRRILYRHLDYPSPYNTYYVYGLPPGVICAPNPSTIDQVLNYEEHNYLFFCAKPGYNSRHTFSVTNRQHERNRQIYHAWLRSEGIR